MVNFWASAPSWWHVWHYCDENGQPVDKRIATLKRLSWFKTEFEARTFAAAWDGVVDGEGELGNYEKWAPEITWRDL